MSVSTFFPDPSPESTSVDGRTYITGANSPWATIIAASGTGAQDNASISASPILQSSTTTNQYQILTRSAFLFDTSAIDAGDDISEATFSICVYGKHNALGLEADSGSAIVLCASAPASNTAVASGDHVLYGSTEFGRTGNQSTLSTGLTNYNDTTLNISGLAAIAKDGVTKLGQLIAFDFDETAPTWGSNKGQGIDTYSAEQADTTSDPKLVVTHAEPPVTEKMFLMF